MTLLTPGRILRLREPFHRAVADRFRRVSFHNSMSIVSDLKEPNHRCRSVGAMAPDHPCIDQPRRPGPWHGTAPASQLPSIRYASDGRRWAAVTLDVSASRCVGEGSTRRECKCGAENNRSGQHEFSDREHCCFLSDWSIAFAARCDGQTYWNNHYSSRSSNWPIIPVGRCGKLIAQSNCCEAPSTGTNFFLIHESSRFSP